MLKNLSSASARLRFCIPGHKGKPPLGLEHADWFKSDITELPFSDNLYAPSGIIKTAQEKAASIYKARASFFLTNGSSAGVLAAMLACLKPYDKVIIARNCHVSVISGLILTGAYPVFIKPSDTGNGFFGSILPDDIKNALVKHSNAKAVIITSPTYEGIVSDIKKIAKITKQANALLIADAAHGAHLPFSNKFPPYPCEADIVVTSLHKTLPVPGQCALLNISNDTITQRILPALSLVQTSSPSYFMLSSMDWLLSNLQEGKYNFAAYIAVLTAFRESLQNSECFSLYTASNADISKLVFLFKKGTGTRFNEILSTNHAIDTEAGYLNHALAVSSISDTKEDFNAFLQALKKIEVLFQKLPAPPSPDSCPGYISLAPALTPREAYFSPFEYVPLSRAAGKTAARTFYLCPPGYPLFIPGEAITPETALFIKKEKGDISLPVITNG